MSVYVEYDPWSRTGNRMFQYAFAHKIANLRRETLYADELPEFLSDSLPEYDMSLISARKHYCKYTRDYGSHNVDINELLTTDRDIIVNSFVQKASYYTDYRDLLRLIFKPRVNVGTKSLTNTLVVHIRETDYVGINCFLGYQFYKDLIRDSGFNNVTIVTDNSECDTVKRLHADGCDVNTYGTTRDFKVSLDERSMLDFCTMMNCENLALSQSSFSWWAAFLGNHKRVIFPFRKSIGIWPIMPGKDDIDLFFDSPVNQKYIHD